MHHADLPKAYEPRQVEDRIYQFWLDKGYFTPKIDHSRQPFTIIMPPPNVTGELHLGHALTATLEDIMIRWHRMKGEPTPLAARRRPRRHRHPGRGGEAAGRREGMTRHDIGREEFVKRAWEWASQVPPAHQRAAPEAGRLLRLDAGALHPGRGAQSARCAPPSSTSTRRGSSTAASASSTGARAARPPSPTSRVDTRTWPATSTTSATRWSASRDYVTVATTRPETMLGDVAVAVNPEETNATPSSSARPWPSAGDQPPHPDHRR